MMSSTPSKRRTGGFSLIELAIVLVIVGLLVGGGITALIATNTQAQRSQQKRQMEQVRTALYGFAMAHGRLPCPDGTDADGLEDISGTSCSTSVANGGRLPWATLGLGRRDAWGHPLRYRVDTDFAGEPVDASGSTDVNGSAFGFTTPGNLIVKDGDGETVASDTPAVVVAYGPQGGQIWTSSGFNCPAAGSQGFSDDEHENCNGSTTFVVSDYRRASAPDGGRFDDLVVWLPRSVLIAHMVKAGRLPRQ